MKKYFVGRLCRVLFFISIFICLVLLSACANKQYKFDYVLPEVVNAETADDKITAKNNADWVWPLTPEVPRYRYLGDIKGDENFTEVENSASSLSKSISWLGTLVFGEEPALMLHRPQSGVFDKKNNRLFVTDVGQRKVVVFDLENKFVETWDGGSEQSFISPIAVVILASGDVLVSDAELGAVLRFDTTGKYLGLFGSGQYDDNKRNEKDEKLKVGQKKKKYKKHLARPTGIAYDRKSKKVFVADSQAHQIHVFDEKGDWLFAFGSKGRGDGKFNSPTHLAFANNVLHVSDTLNARVQMFDTSGKWLRSFGRRGLNVGDMPRPKGIAVDSDSNIYVVESYYDYLLMFNPQGQGLMALGGSGSTPGKFDLPAGVWVDETDKVYVADMFNQRISVFQYLSARHKNEIKK